MGWESGGGGVGCVCVCESPYLQRLPFKEGDTKCQKLRNSQIEVVLKTVNRKPICRPKDTDPVTFRFLVTKTGFATCRHYLNLSLPKY